MYKIETKDIGEVGLERNYVCASVNRGDALSRACEIIKRALGGKPFEFRHHKDGVYFVFNGSVVLGTFKLIKA